LGQGLQASADHAQEGLRNGFSRTVLELGENAPHHGLVPESLDVGRRGRLAGVDRRDQRPESIGCRSFTAGAFRGRVAEQWQGLAACSAAGEKDFPLAGDQDVFQAGPAVGDGMARGILYEPPIQTGERAGH
jgi:hypothetical protein